MAFDARKWKTIWKNERRRMATAAILPTESGERVEQLLRNENVLGILLAAFPHFFLSSISRFVSAFILLISFSSRLSGRGATQSELRSISESRCARTQCLCECVSALFRFSFLSTRAVMSPKRNFARLQLLSHCASDSIERSSVWNDASGCRFCREREPNLGIDAR